MGFSPWRKTIQSFVFPLSAPRDKPLGDNRKQPHLLAKIREEEY